MGLPGFLKSERGSVLPLFAVCMTAIIGFAAISLDAGRMYVTKSLLQNVADSAVLAGVTSLPSSPSEALLRAYGYAAANGVSPFSTSVTVEGASGRQLRVRVERNIRLEFAGVLVSNRETISATSTAQVGVCIAAKGAQPFGIEEAPFAIGQSYVLKLDSDSVPGPTSGNFHALALGLRGANNYRDNVQYGYQGVLSVGDVVETETGNMEGPTQQGLSVRLNADPGATYANYSSTSPRVLLVPVIDSFEVNGRKVVEVLGFASFFLEDYRVVSSGSDEIVGRFIRRVAPGEVDDSGTAVNYGTTSVKLIR